MGMGLGTMVLMGKWLRKRDGGGDDDTFCAILVVEAGPAFEKMPIPVAKAATLSRVKAPESEL